MAEIDAPPILSSFRILGLHGYKNVTLDFAGPARIVIAENGMGKTTILSALQAFLTKNFSKLQYLSSNQLNVISFLSINLWYFIEMSSRILLIQAQTKDSGNCLNSLKLIRWNSSTRFLKVISIILPKSLANPILQQIYYQSPLSAEQLLEYVHTIQSAILQTRSEKLKDLITEITSLTQSYEILYLPTYRRIEIPIRRTPRRLHRLRSQPSRRVGNQGRRI